MSIRDEIRNHVRSGRFVLVYPAFSSVGVRRSLFVASEIWDELEGCWDEGGDERMATLYADLEVFIGGHLIGPQYLSLLTPKKEGVFQIKSKYPYPQLRLIGRFAEQDVFIGTHLWDRDKLGRFGSSEWETAFEACKETWEDNFPNHEPLMGTVKIHDYVTNAAPAKYFR